MVCFKAANQTLQCYFRSRFEIRSPDLVTDLDQGQGHITNICDRQLSEKKQSANVYSYIINIYLGFTVDKKPNIHHQIVFYIL